MKELKLIGDVAQKLGINPKTIRYYEQIGLIPEPQRTSRGYRLFSQEESERIAFIRRARALDFSLDDIGEILDFREQGEAPCLYVTELVEKRMDEIDAKIAALNQLRRDLKGLHEQAKWLPRENILNKDCICHLIENQQLIA